MLRQEDLEQFEDEPLEYIKKDLEGTVASRGYMGILYETDLADNYGIWLRLSSVYRFPNSLQERTRAHVERAPSTWCAHSAANTRASW